MKNTLTLFTTFIDTATGKIVQQVLTEKAEAIYNRVLAIKDNENIITIEIFDEKCNIIFSK